MTEHDRWNFGNISSRREAAGWGACGPESAHQVPPPIDSRCVEELSDALLAAGQIDSAGAGQHAIEPPLIRMFGNELSPPIG